MKKVTINFKFEIGDEVIFIGTRNKKRKGFIRKLTEKELENIHAAPAQVFKVTDRFYEECYGGVQLHYNLRPMMYGEAGELSDNFNLSGISKELIKAREIELEKALD